MPFNIKTSTVQPHVDERPFILIFGSEENFATKKFLRAELKRSSRTKKFLRAILFASRRFNSSCRPLVRFERKRSVVIISPFCRNTRYITFVCCCTCLISLLKSEVLWLIFFRSRPWYFANHYPNRNGRTKRIFSDTFGLSNPS